MSRKTAQANFPQSSSLQADSSTDESALLEGTLSVKAALIGKSREIEVILIARSRNDHKNRQLRELAQAANVSIKMVPREQVDSLASGTSHGGVLALAGPRKYTALGALLPADHAPFIVMLDGIEDPFSFGGAIRALYAAGVDGLVVRERNWNTAAATVARASAGASELIPTAVVDVPTTAADFFRRRELVIAITAKRKGAIPLYDADLKRPLFLLIGGEKRGIQRSFLSQADCLLEVPYGRNFEESLGAAATAGIIGFEVMRQRQR